MYIDQHSGEKRNGIIIFGGDGINYEQPSSGSSFLQDLWILSIGNRAKVSAPGETALGAYTHSWSRIAEESSSVSSAVTSNDVPPVWPGRRWNFGHTVTEHGWFLIYGGEDAANNIHYDDTWVFYLNKWLKLKAFGGGQTGFGPQIELGPGRRKGASLLLMPLSGLVILWGGQRPPVGGGKRQGKDFAGALISDVDTDSDTYIDGYLKELHYSETGGKNHNADILAFSTSSSGKEGGESIGEAYLKQRRDSRISSAAIGAAKHENNKTTVGAHDGYESRRGRSRGRGPSVQCLSDTYIFNATAALLDATEEMKHSYQPSHGDHLKLDTWRRVADFPGSCLFGATAVGILDPQDSREKLFAFGGRYRAGFSSEKDEGNVNTAYLLSNDIWLYDPIKDTWTKVSRDITKDLNWPEGRDKHAMVYVAELNTVFVSGGRLSDPNVNLGHDNFNQKSMNGESSVNSNDDASYDDDTKSGMSMTDMDLWGYNLITRKWSQYGDTDSEYDDDNNNDNVVLNDMNMKVNVRTVEELDSKKGNELQLIDNTKNIQENSATGTSNSNSNSNSNGESERESWKESESESEGKVIGRNPRSNNDGNNNNKWWVGAAGDMPAARYQHGLSVWRGPTGTEAPYLVCFGGERSDTPWQLQGGMQNGQSKYKVKYIQHNDKYLRRNKEVEKVFLERKDLQAEAEVEVERKAERNEEEDRLTTPSADQVAIDDDSFSGNAGGDETDGGGGGGILGPVSSHAQSNDLWLLPLRISSGSAKEEGSVDASHEDDPNGTLDSLYSDMNDDNNDDNINNDNDGNSDNDSINDNDNDDDSNNNNNDHNSINNNGHQLGSTGYYFHKYDVLADVDLDLRNWNIFDHLFDPIFDLFHNSMVDNKDVYAEILKYDDSDNDDTYNKNNKIVDQYDSNKNDNNIMKERTLEKVIRTSSSGGNSGSHKGKGPGRGTVRGDNPRKHRSTPHTNSSSSSNSSGNSNNNDRNDKNQNSSKAVTDDDNDQRGSGWTLLSAGGCHYLDDGR